MRSHTSQHFVPRVLAIANQKGGVGKTTTAVNLATAMSAIGRNVLIFDMDPQGNASTGFGISRRHRKLDTYRVLAGEATVADAAVATEVPNLSIVPAGVDLAGAEIELVNMHQREYFLKKALKSGALEDYDTILIDCPPSLNLLTINALVAADSLIVPLQCEFYALEGISLLVKTVERVRRIFNPSLEVGGVLLTMFDKRTNLSEMVAEDVRAYFGDKVFKTAIPRNVRVTEAPSHGKPVLLYDWRCTGSQAYIKLAGEILRREKELAA